MKTGIRSIIEKIHSDAENHSAERYNEIKETTDIEIENENANYIKELEDAKEALIIQNEHDYSYQIERLKSHKHREILIYRHELTDKIFDAALLKLRSADNEEFISMFKNAVKKLSGSFVLYPGEFSIDKLKKEAIEEVQKDNAGLSISLSSEFIPQKSGFVLKSDKIEYNCLFEDLIEEKKSVLATAVLKEVFEN